MGLPKDATLIVEPFKIAILDSKLDELHTLIKLSKLPPPTYEGTKEEYGVTSKWMKEAKAHWNDRFSWYVSLAYSGREQDTNTTVGIYVGGNTKKRSTNIHNTRL